MFSRQNAAEFPKEGGRDRGTEGGKEKIWIYE
jgi:hypothetical protein